MLQIGRFGGYPPLDPRAAPQCVSSQDSSSRATHSRVIQNRDTSSLVLPTRAARLAKAWLQRTPSARVILIREVLNPEPLNCAPQETAIILTTEAEFVDNVFVH